jgi:hypothetical protein
MIPQRRPGDIFAPLLSEIRLILGYPVCRICPVNAEIAVFNRRVDQMCLLPEATPRGETVWPDGEMLGELNSTVSTLATMERKKPPASRWRAYKCVSKRWQRYHLLSRVEKLIWRARARLQEESEMPSKNAYRCEAFLEWIAGLGHSEFLDVIDMVYKHCPATQ